MGKTKGFIKTKSLGQGVLSSHGRGGWVGGWVGRWVGLRVGFININDMSNNDGGQGAARVCEAHEVK